MALYGRNIRNNGSITQHKGPGNMYRKRYVACKVIYYVRYIVNHTFIEIFRRYNK